MSDLFPRFTLFFLCLSFFARISAFTFGSSPPTQCDPFTLSWTGGTPPYDILLIPDRDAPRKYTISSYPDGGTFNIQLPLPVGMKFLVTMSDATGFATGGVSDLLIVGSSISQPNCDTATPKLSFLFDLPDPLVQCASYGIAWDTAAVLPVTITGLVPSGSPVQLTSTGTSNVFTWNQASVQENTTIIFFVTDSEGRFGGSSSFLTVGNSSDSSCLNAQSPQTTSESSQGTPTASNTALPGGSSTSGAPQATVTIAPSKGVSAAAIGGAIAGALVACLIIGSLVAFFFRTYLPTRRAASRYSRNPSFSGDAPLPPNQRYSSNPLTDFTQHPYGSQGASPSNWTTFSSSNAAFGGEYVAEPFSTSSVHGRYPQSTAALSQNTLLTPAVPAPGSQRPSHTSKKSLDYPPNEPARFILHTDVEETIELPPQYRERSQQPKLPDP